MRADAVRNRERLMDVAREAFVRDGVDTSLEEIARLWEGDVRCEPKLDPGARVREMEGWREALQRVRSH